MASYFSEARAFGKVKYNVLLLFPPLLTLRASILDLSVTTTTILPLGACCVIMHKVYWLRAFSLLKYGKNRASSYLVFSNFYWLPFIYPADKIYQMSNTLRNKPASKRSIEIYMALEENSRLTQFSPSKLKKMYLRLRIKLHEEGKNT